MHHAYIVHVYAAKTHEEKKRATGHAAHARAKN
jgi:hypothetical protein